MRTKLLIRLIVFTAICFAAQHAQAQTQKPSPQPTPDDVLRINTELVQTDVMVFDKAGKFVSGLTRTCTLCGGCNTVAGNKRLKIALELTTEPAALNTRTS